jgi:micrococcal nuclease
MLMANLEVRLRAPAELTRVGQCIPPVLQGGDLDCGDIPYRRFTVVPPDPHNFDGDHDGIGCDSG